MKVYPNVFGHTGEYKRRKERPAPSQKEQVELFVSWLAHKHGVTHIVYSGDSRLQILATPKSRKRRLAVIVGERDGSVLARVDDGASSIVGLYENYELIGA